MEVQVSFPLAFAAGVVSFLSPCVLPVVPSYVAFVSGVTLEDLRDGSVAGARRTAVIHAALFVAGFSLVFMTLGLVASSMGSSLVRALPWVNRGGGVLVLLFGLYLADWLPVPSLYRERRFHLSRRPVGFLGSLAIGVAFGAGWTPGIGPILGSILLYAGLEATMTHGTLLLGTYALGLGIPFVASAAGLNWLIAGGPRIRSFIRPLQRVAGAVLVLIGVLMVTGRFAKLTAFLAGMGQLINLDMS